MNTEEILALIDAQIARLQEARDLITSSAIQELAKPQRGRPKGSTNKTAAVPAKAPRRVMSAEGKARIVAAQKARWAAQKKAAKSGKAGKAAKKSITATVNKSVARAEPTERP